MREKAKQAAAAKALEFVEDGMVIGLGTGSTARYFIEGLIKKKAHIQAVATSKESQKQAEQGGIKLVETDRVDLVVDGADAVDPDLDLIKGAGGALLREKIVASMAEEMIVLVDESKLVHTLQEIALPVEILPFGITATLEQIKQLGFTPAVRDFETDNGNRIADLVWGDLAPASAETKLHAIPGVLETGLFLGMATKVIVGKEDGTTEILTGAKKGLKP